MSLAGNCAVFLVLLHTVEQRFPNFLTRGALFRINLYGGAHCLPYVLQVNPLNAELNPICHLLALLGAHHILHVSRIRVNGV